MKITNITAVAILLLTACNQVENRESHPGNVAIHVTTALVKNEKVVSALRYSGTIEAYQSIPLNFQTTGTVQQVWVDAGDLVTKGQLLASLDPSDAKNMYEITLSQFQQAKDAYDRLKSVYDKGSLPEIKWVEMESKLDQARSSLDIAKNNLDKCNMLAPVSGMVGRRNIEPGMSSISITSAPLELVDIRQVYVKIAVPENEVARITRGMKATFMVSALNDMEFNGAIASVSPVADRFSRTYEAKILVQNPELALKPGMVCDVKMEITMEREVLLVPGRSVSKDYKNNTFVFLIDPVIKKAKKQIVRTGQYHDNGLEIVSGLKAGQLIVNEGKEKVSDNSLIAW